MRQTDKILRRLLELHPNKLIDLKLDRIERLLQALGRPQDRLPPTIHVAGTNAKGSTIAHLRAFMEAAGKQVHIYTSPHLVRFNERIRLAGKLVGDAQLQEALELCEKHNGGRPITYFEITTAAAFHLFAKVKADYLLLEVGLGGRFDATNVIEQPLGSIITPVSIDHTEFLGSGLGAIALEKTGVLKEGAPAVIGPQPDAARAAIDAEAQKLGVEAKYFGQDFEGFEQYGRLVYQDETGLLDLPPSALNGPFQIENAALAIAAVRYFKLGLSEKHIAAGLRQVSWPGRMMRVKEGRLLAGLSPHQEIWLDGGHNVAGGAALAFALRSMPNSDSRPFVLVLGAYANKDPAGFLAPFARLVENIITMPITGDRQAWIPEELAELARSLGFEAQSAASLESGIERAAKIAGARIVLCGSLHLVGQFLEENQTFPD